jgi:hypothetical protein
LKVAGGPGRIAIGYLATETVGMRIIYLTLGLFVLFNIGAICRTAQPMAENCTAVSGGLIHCKGEETRHHE